MSDDLQQIHIARNEAEANIIMNVLDANDIKSMTRITDFGWGTGGEIASSGGGPRAILVNAEQADRARELLADYEANPAGPIAESEWNAPDGSE